MLVTKSSFSCNISSLFAPKLSFSKENEILALENQEEYDRNFLGNVRKNGNLASLTCPAIQILITMALAEESIVFIKLLIFGRVRYIILLISKNHFLIK